MIRLVHKEIPVRLTLCHFDAIGTVSGSWVITDHAWFDLVRGKRTPIQMTHHEGTRVILLSAAYPELYDRWYPDEFGIYLPGRMKADDSMPISARISDSLTLGKLVAMFQAVGFDLASTCKRLP